MAAIQYYCIAIVERQAFFLIHYLGDIFERIILGKVCLFVCLFYFWAEMRLNGDVIQGIDHISDIYHVDMCKTPYLRHVLAQFLNQVRSHRDSYCPVQTVYTGTVPPDQDSEPGVLAKELMASRIVPALFAAVEFGRVLDLSGPGDAQPPPRETEVEAESLPLVIPSTPILQHQQHDQGSENGEDDVCMEDLEMLDSMEK